MSAFAFAPAASETYLAGHLMQYVDYAGGSDTRSGLSPAKAKKTIQAAYNALVVGATSGDGVGKIIVLPGDHDVGTGIVIDYRYPIEIEGFRGGRGYSTSSKASRIMSSSAAGTELILTGDLNNLTNGNRFVGLTFLVTAATNTALTACIRARANTHLNVDRCYGSTTDSTNRDVPLLEQHPGGTAQDNAWARLTNSVASGLPLYHALNGTNFNRSLIANNVCFFGASATYPMIWLEGDWWQGVVMNNALEGGASAAHITLGSTADSANENLFLDNMGESGAGSTPYYHVVNGGNNLFIGGHCTGSGTGTWVQFDANGFPNKVINPWIFQLAGTSGYKRAIVNNATYPALNIIEGKNGRMYHFKTGAAPAFTSADFNAAPPDGTLVGSSHGSTLGRQLLWAYINGTYVAARFKANPDVSGATSVADGGTITHGLGTTPVVVNVTPSVTGEFASVTAIGATTFTVALKKHDNTAGTTQTVYWRAGTA